MARATGLEPATSGVTGRHSNQLSYARAGRLRRGGRQRGVDYGDRPEVSSASVQQSEPVEKYLIPATDLIGPAALFR